MLFTVRNADDLVSVNKVNVASFLLVRTIFCKHLSSHLSLHAISTWFDDHDTLQGFWESMYSLNLKVSRSGLENVLKVELYRTCLMNNKPF